ncbi:MAG: FtsW/RodA/SpoVE family cell cycle protein, partial [Oscillospiraceae bacterium]
MTGAKWLPTLLLMTAFQVFSAAQVVITDTGISTKSATIFGIYIAIEWVYAITASIIHKKASHALEFIAFFLTGIGLVIVASVNEDFLVKQFIAVVLGISCFIFLLWLISNVDRAMFMRTPMAVAAIVLLILTLVVAKNINGAFNWISIGSFSFQPSELVKVAFIFVGAAALEKLQSTRSLTQYIVFAVVCIALLFLMRDLGTALIFFFTFLILAFMRSGDIRTIILVCVAAAMGAGLIVLIKSDYVIQRFSNYRHIWESMDGGGYQQTRVLIYSVSGGL